MRLRNRRCRTAHSSLEALAMIALILLGLIACVLIWRKPILETNRKFVERAKALLIGEASPQQKSS